MNYIIVDLEATCWEQRAEGQNEIIEIGAVKVNSDRQIEEEFVQFVKPLKNPLLSDFCKELTSIRQKDVDEAPYFYEAVKSFQDWIGKDPYFLCSWGFYDLKQFEHDCQLHQLDQEWLQNHISIKHQHGKIRELKRAIGMKNALKLEQIQMTGTHHRGIDDARNITKIFLRYFDEWDYNY